MSLAEFTLVFGQTVLIYTAIIVDEEYITENLALCAHIECCNSDAYIKSINMMSNRVA